MTPLSVVLAVHNGERHLEASVRSILTQTLPDFELIVVDDGSTDGTPEVLSALRRDDPRIVTVRQENSGLAASLNRGFELARGAYIARQDADDISLPHRFERQAAFLDAHPSIAAVGSSIDVIDRAGTVVGALNAVSGSRAVRRGLLTLRTTPAHGSMMMRKAAVQGVGGYREAFRAGQDYDLWLRLSSAGAIDNLPDVLYQWRLIGESVYGSRRATQLKYAGIALAMDRERSTGGQDSYDLLLRCGEDLDEFAARYRLGPYLRSLWGELLLRGLGNSAAVRAHFRAALAGGSARPWTVCLFGWTHLGLPWPGSRPLAPSEAREGGP